MTIATILNSKEAVNEALSVLNGKHPFWVEAKDDMKLIRNEIKQVKQLFKKDLKHISKTTADELENLRKDSIYSAVC